MNEIKNILINRARELYKEIEPCSNRSELSECFTKEGDMLLLWFNTSDNSTHVISADLN